MKPRIVNLYKWKLVDRTSRQPISDAFIIDRGDNKRRSASYLKINLLAISGLQDSNAITIGGFELFRGFAVSYNVKE